MHRASYYPVKLLHTASSYTEKLLHTHNFFTENREAFTHRSSYTEKLLHRASFCTEKLSLTASFYREKPLHTEARQPAIVIATASQGRRASHSQPPSQPSPPSHLASHAKKPCFANSQRAGRMPKAVKYINCYQPLICA